MGQTAAEVRNGDTVKDLLERYRRWLVVERGNSETTVHEYTNKTKQFLKWLQAHGHSLEDVDQEIVNAYLYECNEHYKHNSLKLITCNLRCFLSYFLEKDISVRIASHKSPDRDKTPLTREQVDAMFEAAQEDAEAEGVLKTMYYSGIRCKELRNLDIDDVDFSRLQITVRHGKNDAYRVVNITKDCAVAIQRYLMKRKNANTDALFLSATEQRINANTVRKIVKENAAKAGINRNVYPHLFRITMISHMAEQGLSPREIQAQSGHDDIKTLLGYIQHTPQRIRNSYDSVFERDDIPTPEDKIKDTFDGYKKKAMMKYLDGEIDRETLNQMLHSIESHDEGKTQPEDIAFG